MKSVAAGTASGCVLWLIAFFILAMCLCSVAGFVGGFTSTLGADWVAGIMEPILCPDDSQAEIVTSQTTIMDESGVEQPAVSYAMQCVDAAGNVVREPSPDFAFYWIGMTMLLSLVLAAVLAFFLAAPIGGLVARFSQRRSQPRS
jgi:hypothetical protein